MRGDIAAVARPAPDASIGWRRSNGPDTIRHSYIMSPTSRPDDHPDAPCVAHTPPALHVSAARPPRPTSPTPASPDRAADGPSDHRAVILVVDRDPNVRELESYFLNEAGFEVEFAEDGLAALELARRLRPDIVVSEVLVPKMDGLALCRALKSDPATRHVAVLVFSILAAGGRAREAGADAFLMKPLAERRLVDTVRSLLAARQRSAAPADSASPPATSASRSTPQQP